ncbi:MAG: DUF547 domain-containing protein [Saprospiraceae bacterium]
MKYSIFAIILFAIPLILFLGLQSCVSVKEYNSNSKPVNHALWDTLVNEHVTASGDVDYKGFIADSTRFNNYLDLLSSAHPNKKNWSRDEQLAYWINAYNAFTVKIIIDNYPVESIKNIKEGLPFVSDTWTVEFIKIEDRMYNLNNIEHGIIRPNFKEPRIHFAVNCASISCPKLRNEAFTAEKLEKQLAEQARDFLRDESKNKFTSSEEVKLSKIFDWFKGDFKEKYPSVTAFVNEYGPIKLDTDASLDYLDYDWNLNDVGTASTN